jgi:hypothetical protein
MVSFFYSLPIWLATIVVLAVSLLIGLASSLGIRKAFRLRSTPEETASALSLMQVVAAYIGILIAFAAVQVWQDYADAEHAVQREAASASQVYRDLAAYGPQTMVARRQLRVYVDSIVNDEWPLLPRAKASPKTSLALFRLFDTIAKIRPQDNRDTAIYREAFDNLNDLVQLRRDRLIHSESQVPSILWIVGLVGSVLIVGYTATFPASRTNTLMIGGISMALGLVFLFILVVDRPYMGEFAVSNRQLAELSRTFDLLDRLSGPSKQAPDH